MIDPLLFVLIVLPFLSGLVIFFLRADGIRRLLVIATAAVVAAAAVWTAVQGPFLAAPHSLLGLPFDPLILGFDGVLLLAILYFGFRHRSPLIVAFALAQAVMSAWLEFGLVDHAAEKTYPLFVGDALALVMVLVVSLVGGLIAVFGLPYMAEHERHLKLARSRQPRFFLVLIAFLGAMNGLVLSNDLGHFYFFFEVTTLASFLLIGHDGTEIATRNAVRALWMNSLGGAALMGGIVWSHISLGTLEIAAVIDGAPGGLGMTVALGLLILAGFTKAAQMPFQSWLLGAMVAPTPVSALLHSSTMVKAGVYLIIRFAPAFADTLLGTMVALFGAFTFLGTAALAVGQSNGKKVLAYSTISNLGLIVACAGIGTPTAITAAILLIIFHAVSKALLFLCVGTIEQGIGSRDIEVMRGVYTKMPVTALIMLVGVVTMILPPFGMLLGKWMAIESAAGNLLVIVMLAVGSAITVLYWARWAGLLMSADTAETPRREAQSPLTRLPLAGLALGAVALSAVAPWVYAHMVIPALGAFGAPPFSVAGGGLSDGVGAFAVVPLFVVAAVGFVFAVRALRGAGAPGRHGTPYLSGVQSPAAPTAYVGPMDEATVPVASNYYMPRLFGEEVLTPWVNGAAVALIVGLFIVGGLTG